MSDIVKNTVNSITFQFPLKEDDFKELSLKALTIKKWIDENGQELAEFIYRHHNHYALNNYQDVHLNDMPRTISKVDIVFREPLEKIKSFKDDLNKIRNNIISLEKVLENNKIDIKNDMIQAQKYKQKQFIKEQEKIKNERIEFANNLTEDIGLDMDQIHDEQVRAMEDVAELDKKMEKVVSKFRKDKLKNDQIIIKGFKKEISAFDLLSLLDKGLILLNEKEIKNIVKKQYEENNFLGISGIEIEVQK